MPASMRIFGKRTSFGLFLNKGHAETRCRFDSRLKRWRASVVAMFCLCLVLAASAAGASIATTNAEGLILWIEFEETDFPSGTETIGFLGVSNTLDQAHPFDWSTGTRDLGVGDFVVMRQTDAGFLEDVAPSREKGTKIISSGIGPLGPNETQKFIGFLRLRYSLDPGTYLVSAAGSIPSTNGPGLYFQFKTPPVAIRILPSTNQPPRQTNAAMVPTMTPVSPPPDISGQSAVPRKPSIPQRADPESGPVPALPSSNQSERNLFYGLCLAGILLLAGIVWWRLRRNRS